jgi:alkaline phosphatase D
MKQGVPSWVAAFLLIFASPGWAGLPILQGYTDQHSVSFSVVVPTSEKFRYEISRMEHNEHVFLPLQVHSFSRTGEPERVDRVDFRMVGQPGSWILRVFRLGKNIESVDQRKFHFLDLDQPHLRFGVVSCAFDVMHHADIWNQLAAQHPDLLIFLGDNVYADRKSLLNVRPADPKQLWERYVKTRHRLRFYQFPELIPVLATWDDHDFGADDMNGTYRFSAESKEIFDSFYAQESFPGSKIAHGPGVSSFLSTGSMNFMLLDDRTFNLGEAGDASESMLGVAQEEWIADRLAQSPKPTWIMNGLQFYGGYHAKDSFEGVHPRSLARFENRVRAAAAPVILVSGDTHFSEIMEIESEKLGYPTFEFTSSSIHSFATPFNNWSHNPRRIFSTWHHNFAVVDAEGIRGNELKGSISFFNRYGTELIRRSFDVMK